jgi:DNA-directed RNA polymerase specialized sigma24 family protein
VIQNLDPLHQQAFQLFYWNDRTPAEIAEELSVTAGRPVKLVEVLSMIDRINETLTERHYSDLVSMTARSRPPVSLDAALEEGTIDPPDRTASPEVRVAGRERQAAFETALAGLAAEDAAIVRLHYVQGLALPDVRRALHLTDLSRSRLAAIVDTLRERLGEAPAPMPVAGDRP